MSKPVHEDDPWAWKRLPYSTRQQLYLIRPLRTRITPWSMHTFPAVLIIFLAGLLVASTRLLQEAVFFSIIGITIFLMSVIIGALYPTKYQIFNEKIRIVLGYVLHFDIPFSNIENVTAATWQDLCGLNLNFINSYSSDDILQITRKHGAKIHITPGDRDQFLENLNKAVYDWKRNNLKN